MLARAPERLEGALGLLDPTHRALLELSLHREVADPALAELLRTDVDAVARQRAEALERVGDILGAPPGEVELALIRHWRGEPEEAPVLEEVPRIAGEPPEETPERRPRRALWAALTAAAALGLVLIIVLGGGGDDEAQQPRNERGAPAEAPAPEPPQPARPDAVELQPVADGGAAGTGRIVEGRVVLRVEGLTRENHAVWLYNSVGEARPVASFHGPRATARFRLPEGYGRFRYLDVSREPPDGNPNHSGESVLRLLLKDLGAG